MKVYQFIDSEVHFIAARDEVEARNFYAGSLNEDGDEDFTVKEIPRERWPRINVRDDDVPGGKTTVEAIVGTGADRDAFLVSSTVW